MPVEDPAKTIAVDEELTIVLSDVGFDKSGKLESAESGGAQHVVRP